MSTISDLPDEMISIILSNNDINIQDIINVSNTCKRFYDTVKYCGNTFWQRKFYQRWPCLKRICAEEIQEHIDFKELIKTRTKCKKRLRDYLAHMNKQWFFIYESEEKYKQEYSIFRNFHSIESKVFVQVNRDDIDFLIDQKDETRFFNCYCLVDELISLLEESESGKFDELTNIFYGKKLLPYLKHYYLKNVWQKFINRPAEQQLMEEATVFAMQWTRPEKDISYSHIETELDNYAYQAMEFLRIENPKHPILLVSHEQLSFWKYNNIDENQWNKGDTRQILNIICKVLGNKSNYIVSQAMIFHGVARRLGIRCDIMCNNSYLNQLLLIWKPKYNTTNNLNNEQHFNIKASHYGSDFYQPCQPSRQITVELMNNFTYYRLNSVELVTKLIEHTESLRFRQESWFPYVYMESWKYKFYALMQHTRHTRCSINAITIFASYHIYKEMDLSPIATALEKIVDDNIGFDETNYAKSILNSVLTYIQEIKSESLDKIRHTKPKPKQRKPEMEFAVGMIVTIENREIGVIIGWEEQSPETLLARFSWSYTVCCKNRILYRIGQDKLTKAVISDNDPIYRIENIGKYFCKFNGSYYMPNEMMRKVYEEDVVFLINNF